MKPNGIFYICVILIQKCHQTEIKEGNGSPPRDCPCYKKTSIGDSKDYLCIRIMFVDVKIVDTWICQKKVPGREACKRYIDDQHKICEKFAFNQDDTGKHSDDLNPVEEIDDIDPKWINADPGKLESCQQECNKETYKKDGDCTVYDACVEITYAPRGFSIVCVNSESTGKCADYINKPIFECNIFWLNGDFNKTLLLPSDCNPTNDTSTVEANSDQGQKTKTNNTGNYVETTDECGCENECGCDDECGSDDETSFTGKQLPLRKTEPSEDYIKPVQSTPPSTTHFNPILLTRLCNRTSPVHRKRRKRSRIILMGSTSIKCNILVISGCFTLALALFTVRT